MSITREYHDDIPSKQYHTLHQHTYTHSALMMFIASTEVSVGKMALDSFLKKGTSDDRWLNKGTSTCLVLEDAWHTHTFGLELRYEGLRVKG